jgi:hypothetical protein
VLADTDLHGPVVLWGGSDVIFRHCTVVNDQCTSSWDTAFQLHNSATVHFDNSLLECRSTGQMLPDDPAVSLDHSLVWPAAPPTVIQTNARFGSPLLVDPAGGDYRLQAGSPCVDAAPHLSGFTQDVEGLPYPVDDPAAANTGGSAGYADCGAHERQP